MYIEKGSFNTSASYTETTKKNGSFSSFDLPVLIENLKHDQAWQKGEMKAMILLKNPSKKIVLAVLHDQTEINSIQTNYSTTIKIIEGKVKFHVGKNCLILKKGELLSLTEKIKYSINSLEETALLIILASEEYSSS